MYHLFVAQGLNFVINQTGIVFGGDGESRTRVRESSASESTCLEPLLI